MIVGTPHRTTSTSSMPSLRCPASSSVDAMQRTSWLTCQLQCLTLLPDYKWSSIRKTWFRRRGGRTLLSTMFYVFQAPLIGQLCSVPRVSPYGKFGYSYYRLIALPLCWWQNQETSFIAYRFSSLIQQFEITFKTKWYLFVTATHTCSFAAPCLGSRCLEPLMKHMHSLLIY